MIQKLDPWEKAGRQIKMNNSKIPYNPCCSSASANTVKITKLRLRKLLLYPTELRGHVKSNLIHNHAVFHNCINLIYSNLLNFTVNYRGKVWDRAGTEFQFSTTNYRLPHRWADYFITRFFNLRSHGGGYYGEGKNTDS